MRGAGLCPVVRRLLQNRFRSNRLQEFFFQFLSWKKIELRTDDKILSSCFQYVKKEKDFLKLFYILKTLVNILSSVLSSSIFVEEFC